MNKHISERLQKKLDSIIATSKEDWVKQAYELEQQEQERIADERAEADAIDLKIDEWKLNRK